MLSASAIFRALRMEAALYITVRAARRILRKTPQRQAARRSRPALQTLLCELKILAAPLDKGTTFPYNSIGPKEKKSPAFQIKGKEDLP